PQCRHQRVFHRPAASAGLPHHDRRYAADRAAGHSRAGVNPGRMADQEFAAFHTSSFRWHPYTMCMANLSEADRYLLERISAGEAEGWTQLVQRYQGRLLAFARGRLSRKEEAEDLVQDTFVAFLEG